MAVRDGRQAWRESRCGQDCGNSEKAYRNLTLLINQSTLPNMFDLCGRPFQIDGNLGGPAVMMEMLVQKHSPGDQDSACPAQRMARRQPDRRSAARRSEG